MAAPSLSTQRLRGSVGLTPMIGGAGALTGSKVAVRPAGPARARATTVPLPTGADTAAANELRERLPSIALFEKLPPEVTRQILQRSEILTHPAGTVLAQEGEVGGPLFVLVDGSARVTRRALRDPLAELHSGEVFGELSLVTDDPRSATVTATADAQILSLTREAMHDLIKLHPPLLLRVLAIARDRMVDALAKTSPLLAPLEQEERDVLLDQFEFREIEQDGILTSRGENVEAMHILLAGNVAVEGKDGETAAMLGAGDVIGEIPLLGDHAALATARATRKTWALALPSSSFRQVVMSSPKLLSALAQLAASQAARALERRVVVA
jgi:CRP-like cAMP-binding protein